jgi:hypothetical protein
MLYLRHFGISCLATLVVFFYHKKSITVKKFGHKCNKKKELEHLNKLVNKFAILIYPPF